MQKTFFSLQPWMQFRQRPAEIKTWLNFFQFCCSFFLSPCVLLVSLIVIQQRGCCSTFAENLFAAKKQKLRFRWKFVDSRNFEKSIYKWFFAAFQIATKNRLSEKSELFLFLKFSKDIKVGWFFLLQRMNSIRSRETGRSRNSDQVSFDEINGAMRKVLLSESPKSPLNFRPILA